MCPFSLQACEHIIHAYTHSTASYGHVLNGSQWQGRGAESQQLDWWSRGLICILYKHSWQLIMRLTRGSDSCGGSLVFVNRMYPEKPWSYLECLVTNNTYNSGGFGAKDLGLSIAHCQALCYICRARVCVCVCMTILNPPFPSWALFCADTHSCIDGFG